MFVTDMTETIPPTDQDIQVARTSSTALASLLEANAPLNVPLRLRISNNSEADIVLPLPAIHLLFHALKEMAKGNTVTLLPVETELTTQQAAEMLRISRPSLINMLNNKKLPYRMVGAHRRVRYEDLLLYLKAERARRAKIMEELVAETERLGLY